MKRNVFSILWEAICRFFSLLFGGKREEEIVQKEIVINGHQVPKLGPDILDLLAQGKTRRVQILDPKTEEEKNMTPYAVTNVKIVFKDENNIVSCVRLLRWSDQRLREIQSTIMWAWAPTYREGMVVNFSVDWYNKEFYEEHKNEYLHNRHLNYYSEFGVTKDDLVIDDVVVGNNAS